MWDGPGVLRLLDSLQVFLHGVAPQRPRPRAGNPRGFISAIALRDQFARAKHGNPNNCLIKIRRRPGLRQRLYPPLPKIRARSEHAALVNCNPIFRQLRQSTHSDNQVTRKNSVPRGEAASEGRRRESVWPRRFVQTVDHWQKTATLSALGSL
jgi:hypothetical protein